MIWITRASSSLGEALACQLNAKSCPIISSARQEKALNRDETRCKFPEDTHVMPLDLSDFESLHLITQKAIKIHGKIDVFINNRNLASGLYLSILNLKYIVN